MPSMYKNISPSFDFIQENYILLFQVNPNKNLKRPNHALCSALIIAVFFSGFSICALE